MKCGFHQLQAAFSVAKARAARKMKKNSAPTARDLQDAIHEEMRGSVEVAAELEVKANALFWIVPDFFRAIENDCRVGFDRLNQHPDNDIDAGRVSSQVARHCKKRSDEAISSEFSKAPYKGFKLHPFAQEWNLEDDFTYALEKCTCKF